MEEDIAGQRSAGIRERYSTCTECGRTFLKRASESHEAGLLEDARSEFAEVCRDCERLDRQGETSAIAAPDR